MNMMATTAEVAGRPVTPCPWCGSAANLELRGDGMGRIALHCANCGACGPSAALANGFDEADARAVALWCGRRVGRPVSRELLNRVGTAVRLHCLVGRPDSEAMIGVAWGDLDSLLRSVEPAESPVRD
ncbi:Restriction alleviation protein Lar [Sphingomonas guangdongensis]|uniref:Restriction alleviation protein Lar n=1 Tax=Sphingomonas guangdongensis TaxID=1141890 RepID=A0A285QGL0_9SPHN|nr:Lar family restriction alleviation protein [Sphingomonas guangdongensis]SOB81080.1 Restriction alleviation protein Lar [Sphingomonas guangdongensis]